jgi:hypothetical protein
MIKGRRKIRRNPNGPRNMYFDADAQINIEVYLNEQDATERRRIYESFIYPVFEQLADNLIKVYDFKSPSANSVELKLDCIAFLFESIQKWDPLRGTKAFSYFNVVAKNWLIINTRKHSKRHSMFISMDDPNALSMRQKMQIEENNIIQSPDDVMDQKHVKYEILKMLDDMKVKLNNENEMRCLHAIETLFNSIDDLELLNKRAVHIYLREISGLDRKNVSKALTSLKKHYASMSRDIAHYDIF